MTTTEPKHIYFVYCNQEFYSASLVVYGTYMTKKDAISRIHGLKMDLTAVDTLAMGPQWKTKDNSMRFFIKKYPLGDTITPSDGERITVN